MRYLKCSVSSTRRNLCVAKAPTRHIVSCGVNKIKCRRHFPGRPFLNLNWLLDFDNSASINYRTNGAYVPKAQYPITPTLSDMRSVGSNVHHYC